VLGDAVMLHFIPQQPEKKSKRTLLYEFGKILNLFFSGIVIVTTRWIFQKDQTLNLISGVFVHGWKGV